ncbi:AraC family transcriptional regulator [Paenibacillus dakarensis]|uniref:AraC family transcriptional regulator n=1 Tax=Paenibacillus dakarensis TaxID=1527293 RepID=UPI001FDEB4C7|nr:AraC family transcriptional regulator [Paenibacillus dakarensis]
MTLSDRKRKEFMLPDVDSTFRMFAAHWRTVEPDWKYPVHKHSLFEVNLVLTGTQEMRVNRQIYKQGPGDLLLLNPGDEHESRVIGEEEMTYYCLHFDVDERSFRELLCRNQECYHAEESQLAKAIRPALDKLIALTREESSVRVESRMSVLSALFELFAGISGTLSSSVNGEQAALGMGIKQSASRIASQIERSIEDKVEGYSEAGEQDTIARIAAEMGYSTSSVNRMFTQVYGMSPRQYKSTLMLKKSKLLLMDPELLIEDISARLGYQNMAHFSRQFKRWTGESPSSFRGKFYD